MQAILELVLYVFTSYIITCIYIPFSQVTDKLSKEFAELRWVLLFRVKCEQKEPDINNVDHLSVNVFLFLYVAALKKWKE